MSGNPATDIRELSREALGDFLVQHGEKPFRTGQVFDALWRNGAGSYEEMTTLPKSTRQRLASAFTFHTARPEMVQESSDGTVKVGFRLFDGSLVEGVLIPSDDRFTACISSQAGCPLACTFCATGALGFMRNLTAGEIFDQVVRLAALAAGRRPDAAGKLAPRPLSNIVYMGMGEPFLNYPAVSRSIALLTDEKGLGMSPQRITVSSVGLPRMIRKMAEENPKWHFALSLHAATDAKRDRLIPLNLKHPLKEITEALKFYVKLTGQRFTIEYILFRDVNDAIQDARDLAVFCKNFPVKINLIAYNPVQGLPYARPEQAKVTAFMQFLESRNLVVNLRRSRGTDIDAACGQLAGRTNTHHP